MKLFKVQLFAVLFEAVCVITIDIPKDNSHYVEGESRFIWMPDGDGKPILVDLDAEERMRKISVGSDNKYLLFTRHNPTTGDILIDKNVNSVRQSHYIPNAPLRVIVHGWLSNGFSRINKLIRKALLDNKNVNVLVLDWGKVASNWCYCAVVKRVPSVGKHLGDFLVWLMKVTGGRLSDVHLIGHSLGAHVIGVAGTTAGSNVGRITGLDPAGPKWRDNPNKLNATAGIYVETINTDGKRLGIFNPLGHTNFYPNGGRNAQPGCWTSMCSHTRAYELFAASVFLNHLVGRKCLSLEEAENNKCQGVPLHMGNDNVNKIGLGYYSLSTEDRFPFHEILPPW